MGTFLHPCENEMVYKSNNEKIPKFNSMVYTQNKQEIGKIDEIFGAINDVV
jgi:H/ACA ribonucleoprotein complex subunit 1